MSFLAVARNAAKEAGKILYDSSDTIHNHSIISKQRFDYVTHVDVAAEEKIISILSETYPDHSILTEEAGLFEQQDEFRWIVDPLDGTTNYIHGYPVSSVSIALAKAGNIILGVIYDPFRDEMFWAEKGAGAFLNNKRIAVTTETELEHCLLATGFPFKIRHTLDQYLFTFKKVFEQVSGMRRAGSAALDLAYVASGRLDGFWESILQPWDMAAGALLVEEAGGRVTDFTGATDFLKTRTVIASNGYIHQPLVDIINSNYYRNNKNWKNENASSGH